MSSFPPKSALELEHLTLLGEEMICEIVDTPIPFQRVRDSLRDILENMAEDHAEGLSLQITQGMRDLEPVLDNQALVTLTAILERLRSDPSVLPDFDKTDKGFGLSLLRHAAMDSAITPVMKLRGRHPLFGNNRLLRDVRKLLGAYPSILRECYETPVEVLVRLTEEMISVRRKLEKMVAKQAQQ